MIVLWWSFLTQPEEIFYEKSADHDADSPRLNYILKSMIILVELLAFFFPD